MPSIINAARLVGASDTYDLILTASTSVDFCSSNRLFHSINSLFSNFSFTILSSASFFLVHDNLVFNLSLVASNFLFLLQFRLAAPAERRGGFGTCGPGTGHYLFRL